MTHNKIFITNLLNGLYKNIDVYLEKSFKNDATYISFMKGLANAIYKKAKVQEIDLPISVVGVDFQESTPYVMAISNFNDSFVTALHDAYYFAVAIDDYENLRVFDFELDVDNNKNTIYSICEYLKDGTRKVLDTAQLLTKAQFVGSLYRILKD